jgi:thioredoxin-dependent peroxiredoxin
MSPRIPALLTLLFPPLAGGCGSALRPDGHRGLLPPGALAPDLSAPDQDGRAHRLRDDRGHAVVVYFYPKDATPGCTREACAFRDAWDRLHQAGIVVLGVSTDDQASHARFATAHRLPFRLLADTDRVWVTAFGVPLRLGMAARVSFLLDGEGRVAKVYPDVDPGVHADQILADAGGLGLLPGTRP